MFILSNFVERGIEMQKDTYARFIDCSKVFNKVKQNDLVKILRQFKFDSGDTTQTYN